METITLSAWAVFIRKIEAIREEYGSYECAGRKFPNRILYRGQADESWHLQTTLERFSSSLWTVASYMEVAHTCLPQLESYLDKSWGISTHWPAVLDEVKRGLREGPDLIPHYDYWVYLRHNGFPSPLLDWSASPWVAAFFAFEENLRAKRVAIYAYVPNKRGHRFSWQGKPRIQVQGPNVRTHKRHFLQQAWYTVAHQEEGDDQKFVSHESAFGEPESGQDILIKLTIPSSERKTALDYLYEYNITRFSLFQTEEALVQTLAFSEIERGAL